MFQWNFEVNTPLERRNLKQVASKNSAFFSILTVAKQAQSLTLNMEGKVRLVVYLFFNQYSTKRDLS